MKVLTAAQMREADRLTTERYGIPGIELMENAGTAIAEFLHEKFADLRNRKILVLCGKGNNGGDGLVAARHLKNSGCPAVVFLFANPGSVEGDAAANLKRWQQGLGEMYVVTSEAEWESARPALVEAELIVDALLGTGLRGHVEGLLGKVIDDLNAARAKRRDKMAVVAVDMPSGLASDSQDFGGPVVRADFTVTLTAPKVGQLVLQNSTRCGELVVKDIGTPPELLESDPHLKINWIQAGEFRALPLAREQASNKGTYGHALIVAGSLGKSGAAILAGRGALRSGAGLVTAATPLDVLPIVAGGMPEMMTAPLVSTDAGTASLRNLDYGKFSEILRGKSVLAIGPGLSMQHETQQFIRHVVGQTEIPIILDADGLNAFAGMKDTLTERKASAMVLTPHPGEMARLLGIAVKEVQLRRLDVALEAAGRWRAYVILKGFHTILATPSGHAYINTTGNPGMATGGTGDVLTGILAGLTAQFGVDDWARVLSLGVYLHGLAGDIAASRVGESPLIASDVIDAIPEAYARVLAAAK
ncbi:MAG TPA: NAD(P)H-hydrate dehydratase [Candidatus Acidoferrales bacterium]|nr:NAD(P)H-hydrate dehydratase [Candidatus Acidoferrales bacterium]